MMTTERHPLQPFLPDGCRLLMLGSFPPAKKRWCMDFFYPNFINDMWRIFGLCFFGDKQWLVDEEHKTFRRDAIERLLTEQGIGLYDTACEVARTKNTASDKDLEVIEETNLEALLDSIPRCHAIATTGQKATDIVTRRFQIAIPPIGGHTPFIYKGRQMRLYRMPSSSRAYPLRVEKKAEYYKKMFLNQLSHE